MARMLSGTLRVGHRKAVSLLECVASDVVSPMQHKSIGKVR